ncbi:MAG: hypothetical protein LKG17_04685 [Megasphaera sp.]|jgi:hypothetical protein|nr:hypothetical protein [Megasphaera sp.]
MTLSLFWSRYTLELHEQHIRPVDELYHYLIAREKWNWFLAKIPEQEQIQILRGHNHGENMWTCRKWLDHMADWIKDNKPPTVYEAVVEKIRLIDAKPIEELEKQAARNISPEELLKLQQAGYFLCIALPENSGK